MKKSEPQKVTFIELHRRSTGVRGGLRLQLRTNGQNLKGQVSPLSDNEAQRKRERMASQVRPIVLALENLLAHARLASHNPEGMRHLLSLYGLDKRFKVELEAMGATERYFTSDSVDALNRQ